MDTKALSFDSTVVLKTAELMAESVDFFDRTAAARLAGWYRFGKSLSILQKLIVDPYFSYTGEQAAAKDAPGCTGLPVVLYRRVYPVRRAAAEELHLIIGFGHTEGIVEEMITR